MVSRLRSAGGALALALACLPALIGAWLVLRIAESIHAGAAGLPQSTLFGAAIGNDALALLRYGFAILLPAAPLALVGSARARTVLLGLGWSLLLCIHGALLHYQWTAGTPLGADLFAYSRAEIKTTLAGAAAFSPLLLGALALSLAVLWGLLILCARPTAPRVGVRAALGAVLISVLAWAMLPERFAPRVVGTDAALNFVINKSMHFADRNLALVRGQALADGPPPQAQATLRAPWEGEDPRYPFLRLERTPDTLGPLFTPATGTPPNLVFVIVEGLGRSFSGPGARLGSFTPFLDELAGRSLYFENFLAGQGRTFGVLTTLFGSLPFGENGLAALGERLPRHDSLTSVLKEHGYRTRFYSGSNLGFDNEDAVLRALGVDEIVSEKDFGPGFERSNEWGYGDRDLMHMALAREASAPAGPHLSIIQTTGMHSPFTFPDKAAYIERARRLMAERAPAAKPISENQRAIFASVLYLDDALRMFFEQAQYLPGYANTIFFITGDHRLPELPMDSRLERYHVPLIVHSPLLKTPRAIKAVSSQFDIAPGVLAYLSNNHGLTSPAWVTWLGTGLDTDPSFRNLHAIPLKQTKTELSDFISGTAYLAQGRLYTIADGMQADRIDDAALLARARAQFDGFVRANGQAGKAQALRPEGVPRVVYGGERTLRSVPLVAQAGDIAVSGVRPRPGTGALTIEATITNHAGSASRAFAPLLVVTNEQGVEVNEVTGDVRTLAAGESVSVALRPDPHKMPPGVYHVSVIPTDPETGRAIGSGQYHVEVRL